MEAQQHLSLREYVRAVTKRWWIVLIFTLVGLGYGAYKYMRTPKAFSASSQIILTHVSNFGIISDVTRMGNSASTKQQEQFVETGNYVDLGRTLSELAPQIHLDLENAATLDDISNVITRDVLNSKPVTPVRLVLYPGQPAPGLLSYEQEAALIEAVPLRRGLDTLATIASKEPKGADFSIDRGWERGHPGTSDNAVWHNLEALANSRLMRETMPALGISDDTARDEMKVADDQDEQMNITGTKLAMAARTLYTLTEIQRLASLPEHAELDEHDKAAFATSIDSAANGPDLFTKAQAIMSSQYVKGMMKGSPGFVGWPAGADDRQESIRKVYGALRVQARKGDPGEAVWDISGKDAGDNMDMIELIQVAPTPELAQRTANAMAAVMVWKDRTFSVADEERSIQFYQNAIGNANSGATKLLRDADDRLTAYQKQHNLLDVETELKSAADRAASLETEQGETEAAIRETSATLNKSISQLGGTQTWVKAPTIAQNPLIAGIKTDIIKSETNLAGLRAQGYTDEWPAIQSEKAQLSNLQQQLKQQVLTNITQQYTPDPVHVQLLQKVAELQSKQVGLEARKQAVDRLIGQMKGQNASLPDVEAEYMRLYRARGIAEQQYTDLFKVLMATRNNWTSKQGNARVVEVAEEPGIKTAPKMRTAAAAALLGLFLGCLCALALSMTDTQIRTAEDVRRELNLPVLAHLPAIPAGTALIVEAMPASPITEGFRALRSTIRFVGGDKPVRTLAATSTRAAEGKSSVVANLAASLAQAGLVVTAVDADLRRPRLAGFFGIPSTTGLTDALSVPGSARQARQATRIPGLYVVPAGPPRPNPGELLDNGRIANVLTELTDGSDMIVVDTPPIGVVTDAALVGSAADATIFVIESGTVDPEEARAAVAKLTQHARANVIGVVLVGGDAPVSSDYVRYVNASNIDSNGLDAPGGTRRPRGRAKA